MASEAKRGVIRIVTNYARLFTTVVLGLYVIRLQLLGVGNDGVAILALLASTVGLTEIFGGIVRDSMIRELGEVYHNGDALAFRRSLSSAVALCIGIAFVSMAVFGVVYAVLPALQISPELLPAARWLLVAKALETFVVLVTAPIFNMYKISERMVSFNMWQIAHRVGHFLAAVILFVFQGMRDPVAGLIAFGLLSAALVIAVKLASVVVMMILDRRTVPHPRYVNRESSKSIIRMGGWNALTILAMKLHLPADAIIMNVFFGLFGNLIWGLATRLTGYVRMLAIGVTEGVDAVTTRLASGERPTQAIQTLIHHTTRLNGFIVFPAVTVVMILASPLLDLWVGDRLAPTDRDEAIDATVLLVRILAVGLAARAISDSWLRILYGAGFVHRYAKLVFLGGLLNPLFALVLLLALPVELEYRYLAVAFAYTVPFLFVHGIMLARVAASALELRVRDLYIPLVRPAIVTAICASIPIAFEFFARRWTFVNVCIALGLFSVAYTLLSLRFLINSGERTFFWNAFVRRVRKVRPAHGK